MFEDHAYVGFKVETIRLYYDQGVIQGLSDEHESVENVANMS